MAVVSAVGFTDPVAGPRFAQFTVTFTGASGLGLHGTNTTAFTVSGGFVLIRWIAGRVTTNLTGASGTLSLGVTGSLAGFIATTTATTMLTTAEIWMSATATANLLAVPASNKDIVVSQNILIASNNGASDVTGGVLVIECVWEPLTSGATLV